ncbi:Barrel-sandwich domain of CusB or HlyD membrane-fusion [Fictibacillus solisalsi]|uniref:Barrel-sandwich domain of CusB or HlyD membrane-fusion n=1 Tax=Fictibacillus solisalsi TaxID=459525 RepID=A0A1H0B236_9BACL|nr:efflux RND transporter periplasmic adaptor subunit [Fictibacillus solisalsi]SDN39676.1 Barrel-sandwich domain of CusB or HlyD membrane-fusion [Fictibacillus solisalsi]
MKKGRLVFANTVGVVVVLALITVCFYYYYQSQNYVETDEATVTTDMTQIISPVSGKLTGWNEEEGDKVKKDKRLAIVSGKEKELPIAAVKGGTIIKNAVKDQQMVQAGEVLAQTADMDHLYVTANIKETELKDIEEGDKVDITIDGDSDAKFEGTVEKIGYAANSVFSQVPSQSSSDNYTKITQKVAVKISVQNPSDKVLPGMNAEIKISI